MIRWVFLDVGNILLDEDPLGFENFRIHWEALRQVAPEVSFRELLAAREKRVETGSRWPLYEVISQYLDDAQCTQVWERAERSIRSRYASLSPVIAGALDTVRKLRSHFRLGLIANQGEECRRWLHDLGLLEAFEVVALSEEVGAHKPDLALYRTAMERASALPSSCLMVGDRLDNDIIPALSLGMKTAWIRWPQRAKKGWCPEDADAIAWRDSLERSAAIQASSPSPVQPTITLDTIAELGGALLPR